MEDGRIRNTQISASSISSSRVHPLFFAAYNARLNKPKGDDAGCWAAMTHDLNQWIQVEFRVARSISGVILQGRAFVDPRQWVTEFIVKHNAGDDDNAWMVVQDSERLNEMVRMTDCLLCLI